MLETVVPLNIYVQTVIIFSGLFNEHEEHILFL